MKDVISKTDLGRRLGRVGWWLAAVVVVLAAVVAGWPERTETEELPVGNVVAVDVQSGKTDAGVAWVRVLVSIAEGGLWYEVGEQGPDRMMVRIPRARSQDGDRDIPVNLANVSWVRTRANRSEAGEEMVVEIDFAGPVKIGHSMLTESVLEVQIYPTFSPEAVDHAAIASSSFIIDLHNDVITQMYEHNDKELFEGNQLQTSWPRLREAGARGAIFAVWVPKDQGPGYEDRLIEMFYEMVYRHRDEMAIARSYADVESNLAADKFSAILAIEGGRAIEQDLGRLDYFYNRGVRYMTLVWNYTHWICDAAKDPNKPFGGLSPFGREVVKRMNELGMIIDVSHASDATVDDVLALSADPIIASHSNCRAVYNHPRNLKDEHIRAICGGGGVIGVNFYSAFLSSSRPARLEDVLRQIDHLRDIGGIECIAIGSDYDGFIIPAAGLENMSKLPNLTAALAKRGYSADDIKKIYGQNFLRVLKKVVDE